MSPAFSWRPSKRLSTAASPTGAVDPPLTPVPPRSSSPYRPSTLTARTVAFSQPQRERDRRDPPNGVAQADVEQRRQGDDPHTGEQLEHDNHADPGCVPASSGEHITHVARRHRVPQEPGGKARDELRNGRRTHKAWDRRLRHHSHDPRLRPGGPRTLRPGQLLRGYADRRDVVRSEERQCEPRRPVVSHIGDHREPTPSTTPAGLRSPHSSGAPASTSHCQLERPASSADVAATVSGLDVWRGRPAAPQLRPPRRRT